MRRHETSPPEHATLEPVQVEADSVRCDNSHVFPLAIFSTTLRSPVPPGDATMPAFGPYDHPPLDRLLRGELDPEQTREAVAHLLRGCSLCSSYIAALLPSYNYDIVFERASAKLHDLAQQHAEDLAIAPSLYEELLGLSPDRRLFFVSNRRRFHSPAFVLYLLKLAREAARRDEPEVSCEAAHLALAILEALRAQAKVPPSLQADLAISAWAQLGNGLRILCRYVESLQAFSAAERRLPDGSGDEEADFLSLRASLYKDLGAFEHADSDLRQAAALLEPKNDRHPVGRLLLKRADVVGLTDPAAGVALLEQAAALLDYRREPRLELILKHRLAWFLNDAGTPWKAYQLFQQTLPLYRQTGDSRIHALRLWLLARILSNLDDIDQAERYLTRAVTAFRELGLAHDHAVSMLDLVGLCLHRGEISGAKSYLLEAARFLESQLHPEGVRVWLDLAQAPTSDALAAAGLYFLRYWHLPRVREIVLPALR
jgi:tetratricopeptide (TPR) repeat protein